MLKGKLKLKKLKNYMTYEIYDDVDNDYGAYSFIIDFSNSDFSVDRAEQILNKMIDLYNAEQETK